MYRQFGHAPSKRLASPVLHGYRRQGESMSPQSCVLLRLWCAVPPYVQDNSDLSVTWGLWCLATPPASILGHCVASDSWAIASWSGLWAVCRKEAVGRAQQCRTLWDVQVCSQHVHPSGSRDADPHWLTSEHTESNALRDRIMNDM
jgi:hypothetical protein